MPDFPLADVQRAVRNLHAARDSGELARVAEAHGIWLVTQFGSSVTSYLGPASPTPGDVDIAYFMDRDATGREHLFAVDALSALAVSDAVDFMDGNAANDVAFYAALFGGVPLYERDAGTFTEIMIYSRRRFEDSQRYREARKRFGAA